MRVECPHCKQKARITSRNVLTDNHSVSDIYCECKNPECEARFVFTLSFKHNINPPAKTTAQIAQNLLNHLSREEKAQLQVL